VNFDPDNYFFSFLDESCRWLISKGRIEETVQILKKIARINRKEVKDDVYHSFEVEIAKYQKVSEGRFHQHIYAQLFPT